MRKARSKKRPITPDPKFNEPLVTKFINAMMLSGKKSTAFSIFYDAIDLIEQKNKNTEVAPLDVWKKALENITPQVEVKSRRVGGATFQVPMEVRPERKQAISMRNMIKYARSRSGKGMAEKLAAEVLAAFNEEGGAFKRKEEMHRMADANKAFAHFRF